MGASPISSCPTTSSAQRKLERLKALAARVRLAVTADSLATVAGAGRRLRGCRSASVGAGRMRHRHGPLRRPEPRGGRRARARSIETAPGLTFKGLMTYPAAGQVETNAAWLAKAKQALIDAKLAPEIVSNGGTPDLWHAHEVTGATEHRPGTYIYLDRYQVAQGVGTLEDCALTVLATVVSRPTRDARRHRCRIEGADQRHLGMEGFGLVLGYPEAVMRSPQRGARGRRFHRQRETARDRRTAPDPPQPRMRGVEPVRRGQSYLGRRSDRADRGRRAGPRRLKSALRSRRLP